MEDRVRTIGCIATLLLAAVPCVCGQTGPATVTEVPYIVFGNVKPAKLTGAVAAVIPPGVTLSGKMQVSTIGLVVAADGTPEDLALLSPSLGPLDDAALAAVRQSKFEPGTLRGKPVPVRACVWVPFMDAGHPAVPLSGGLGRIPGMIAPKPKSNVEARFSDEARKKHRGGTVFVTMTVTEQGMPANVQVVAGPGMGLDEEALKAVRQYRFQPATLLGTPVPSQITVEVNFRLYDYQ
jgi:TonB family protein